MSKEQVSEDSTDIILAKKHIQSYAHSDNSKAWISLGLSLVYEAFAILLIHNNLQILGWALHILNVIRLMVQFHDMAHLSFFQSAELNIFFGKIIGIIQHIPFTTWKNGHNHHHNYFANLDVEDTGQTIHFTKKQYDDMKGAKKILARILREPIIYFFVSIPITWFILLFIFIGKRYGVISFNFLEKVLSVVIFVWVLPWLGVPCWSLWISTYLAQVVETMYFHLQHSVNIPYRSRKQNWNPTRAALQGSTFLLLPKFLKLFSCGIEYHHIHHINSNVPLYAIQQCHNSFQSSNPDKIKWKDLKVNFVDMKLAYQSLWNVMFDEEKSILLPFSYSWF